MTNINTGSGIRRIILKIQQCMYKSEKRYINENLCPEMPAHASNLRHLFGYSQEIINKKSSLPSRVILRRRLISVYNVCSQEFLSKIKKNKLLHPTPLKMKMDCGRSLVRSSGPATFFRGDWSWNHFYGHSFPCVDSSRALVNYWRNDVHLVLVNRLGRLPRNSVVRFTDRRDMTIVVDWDVKPQIKQNKTLYC